MARPTCLAGATCLILAAAPALADLSAADIWNSWKTSGAASGQTISAASETMAGGMLTLIDVAVSMRSGEDRLDTTLPQITLSEQGDGTVAVGIAPLYDLRIRTVPAPGETLDLTLRVAMPGASVQASGDAGAIRYEYTVPDLTVSLAEALVDGTPALFDMALNLMGVTGSHAAQDGATPAFDRAIAAESLALAASGQSPDDGGGTMTLNMGYVDLRSTSSGTGSALAMLRDPARMAAPGTRFESTYTHGGGRIALSVRDPRQGDFDWTGTSGSGNLSSVLADGALDYSGGASALDFSLSANALPLPRIAATMQDFRFAANTPAGPTDVPADFALMLNLGGLIFDESLWGLIDPTGALPRDSASLLLDLSGKISLPDAAIAGQTGALHALTIDTLRLSAAGAELNAGGALNFTTDTAPGASGVPAADGTLDLQLDGGIALLDKLVGLGLIPQDQAMGARMMLGRFATPTGDDTLTSKIEIRPDGGISANGQRLR